MLWLLGVVLSVTASLLSSLGVIVQKKVPPQTELPETHYYTHCCHVRCLTVIVAAADSRLYAI